MITSTGTMAGRPLRPEMPGRGRALFDESRFAASFLRGHGWRLVLVFVGLLLPMWGFAELADEIHEREAIAFDEPLLRLAHALAGPVADRFFVVVARLGYAWFVAPFDVALVVVLVGVRRFREATYAAIALAGSGLLNVATKLVFARERPSLWESITPEATFSFPSGHAMGSATLAWVLLLLAWRTRWRWPVLAAMAAFVLLVGMSRVYLGVHYPSDILAGWAAASIWAAAGFLIVFRGHRHPWQRTRARPPD